MMLITKHALQRFRERITDAPFDFIKQFISQELLNSELLYRVNNIEKRYVNGMVYVLDKQNGVSKVITLYPRFSID